MPRLRLTTIHEHVPESNIGALVAICPGHNNKREDMLRQKIIEPLLQAVSPIFDGTIEPLTLQLYLIDQIKRCIRDFSLDRWGHDAAILRDLERAYHNAALAGLELPIWPLSSYNEVPSKFSLDEANTWSEALPKGLCVSRAGIAPKTGAMMLSLLDLPPSETQRLKQFNRNIEGLMRHVEVRRKDALLIVRNDQTRAEDWSEKHAISILFSRWSREQRDVRFLNSALKLNDWAHHTHLKCSPSRALVDYLLALSEAERTFVEMELENECA